MTYTRTGPELTWEQALETRLPTYRLGHCQLSYLEIPARPREAYLLNWITPPEHRGEGWARDMLITILWLADCTYTTLTTHPDDERLCAGMQRHGFVIDPARMEWQGKPFLTRTPRIPTERPYCLSLLERVQ